MAQTAQRQTASRAAWARMRRGVSQAERLDSQCGTDWEEVGTPVGKQFTGRRVAGANVNPEKQVPHRRFAPVRNDIARSFLYRDQPAAQSRFARPRTGASGAPLFLWGGFGGFQGFVEG